MSPLLLWQYVGWAVFGLILIGILVLVYAMYKDYQQNKDRSSTVLPTLKPKADTDNALTFDADGTGFEAPKPLSRRAARRKESSKDYQAELANKSSSFFDDDDDQEFNLTSGRD